MRWKTQKTQKESSEDIPSVGRRSFFKLAATSAAVGGSTFAGICVTSQPVVAEVNGETVTDSHTSHGEMNERVVGGKINSFGLNGNTEFSVQWDDMVRGDIIEMRMYVKLDQIDGSDVLTESGNKMDYAPIGQMGIQVPTASGIKKVKGSEFFKNRKSVDITDHPDIELEHFNIDLEDSEDYQKEVDFTIKLVGNAPNDAHKFEKVWKYSLTIEAILGLGISLGRALGVGN